MKVLGTIQSIGAPRAYARQDGSYGNAYPVVFSCELGRLGFETFYSQESQQNRGFKVGAVGYVEVSANERTFTDRNGQPRISTDLRVNGWELANQQFNAPAQAADGSAAQTSAPAAPQDSNVQAAPANDGTPF